MFGRRRLKGRVVAGAMMATALTAVVLVGNVGTAGANFAGLQNCKAADTTNGAVSGTFQFTVNAVQSGNPVTEVKSVAVGSCSDPELYDFGTATITESASASTTLTGISVDPSGDLISSDLTTRTVTVTLVNNVTVIATFTNANTPQAPGCTLTWGFYKNHSSVVNSLIGSGTLLVGADQLTAAQVNALLAINQNGPNYLIKLVHQLIAAELNQLGGASTPASVQTAINAANALIAQQGGAFSGTSTPTTTITFGGNTYTASGLEGTLDGYNNGLAAGGPAHCSG